MTESAIIRAEELGHTVKSDPPAIMTAAKRWTCSACGDAVLDYRGTIYGNALDRQCPATYKVTEDTAVTEHIVKHTTLRDKIKQAIAIVPADPFIGRATIDSLADAVLAITNEELTNARNLFLDGYNSAWTQRARIQELEEMLRQRTTQYNAKRDRIARTLQLLTESEEQFEGKEELLQAIRNTITTGCAYCTYPGEYHAVGDNHPAAKDSK